MKAPATALSSVTVKVRPEPSAVLTLSTVTLAGTSVGVGVLVGKAVFVGVGEADGVGLGVGEAVGEGVGVGLLDIAGTAAPEKL